VPLPAIIGHDISGVVEEVGSHVSELGVGDEVYYTPKIFGGPGSYAEQHVADVDLVGRPVRATMSIAITVRARCWSIPPPISRISASSGRTCRQTWRPTSSRSSACWRRTGGPATARHLR
jgi:NADPH:quinone reductase-like Zn-dependent oxidoreductase